VCARGKKCARGSKTHNERVTICKHTIYCAHFPRGAHDPQKNPKIGPFAPGTLVKHKKYNDGCKRLHNFRSSKLPCVKKSEPNRSRLPVTPVSRTSHGHFLLCLQPQKTAAFVVLNESCLQTHSLKRRKTSLQRGGS